MEKGLARGLVGNGYFMLLLYISLQTVVNGPNAILKSHFLCLTLELHIDKAENSPFFTTHQTATVFRLAVS